MNAQTLFAIALLLATLSGVFGLAGAGKLVAKVKDGKTMLMETRKQMRGEMGARLEGLGMILRGRIDQVEADRRADATSTSRMLKRLEETDKGLRSEADALAEAINENADLLNKHLAATTRRIPKGKPRGRSR